MFCDPRQLARLELGHLTVVWLAFILAEGNHRLSHLREWVAARSLSLQAALGVTFVETDFTDDRLARWDYLHDETAWAVFEDQLNARLVARLRFGDRHHSARFHQRQVLWGGDAEGLLQFGHSKDHRPDLPQFKIQLSTLDPLGLPLTATITSGEKADDPLYVPEIDRVRQTLGKRGLLYVGDCKMAALDTRLHLAAAEIFICVRSPPCKCPRQRWRSCWRQCAPALKPCSPSGAKMKKRGGGKKSLKVSNTKSR